MTADEQEDQSPEERDSDQLAADAASHFSTLGAAPVEEARVAAVERLTELRAAGTISEENYLREKRRILRYG